MGVKIKEYVQAWSEFQFSFHFLSFSISLPKLTIFTILRLYMACKMWKIIACTWEISSCRLVEKLHTSAFPMYYSLYWEHEITKLDKKIFASNQKKGHKNKHKKTWMTQRYFQQCACVSVIYFAPVVTTTHRMKTTRGLSLEMNVFAKARAQLLNVLYISTHLSVPHGENI